jgi:hypothetical protein
MMASRSAAPGGECPGLPLSCLVLAEPSANCTIDVSFLACLISRLQGSRPRAASLLFSGCTGQEQSIPIGNVPCLPDFQSPEARLCLWRILAAAFQRCDQLPLVCDVPFTAMETAFGFLQELFIVARAIAAAYRQIDASRFSGMASHAGPTIRQGEWH